LVGEVAAVAIPGDFDGDGDVDLEDFAQFAACYGLPIGSADFTPPTTACRDAFDFDTDGDVDLADVSIFQSAFTTTQP
jgi:hypothetical protein